MSSNSHKHDNTQLLAKFKKILYIGFRATVNFQKSRCSTSHCSVCLTGLLLSAIWDNIVIQFILFLHVINMLGYDKQVKGYDKCMKDYDKYFLCL